MFFTVKLFLIGELSANLCKITGSIFNWKLFLMFVILKKCEYLNELQGVVSLQGKTNANSQ